MMKKRAVFIILIVALVIIVAFVAAPKKAQDKISEPQATSEVPQIQYYTCGMHPSVKVTPEEYNKGKVNCPICNMRLTPVYKEKAETAKVYYGCGVDTEGRCPHCDLGKTDEECICGQHSFIIEGQKIDCPVCGKPMRRLTQEEADKLKGIVSRVKIKGGQIELAGVRTEPVTRRHLHKEIRTVGKVAYDPHLAIAEEEFTSALKALDKIEGGEIPEIKERARNLLESSKRRLRLLGLSEEQIKELERTREIHTSLILPEKKMWIYGDVYEYELSWLKMGEKVKVTTASIPGKEFYGIVSSIDPVLDPKTRSVSFRAEVENVDLLLKPEMYVDVVIMSKYTAPGGWQMVLAVPKDAILDTGTRKIIWIDKGDNTYEGRAVEVGPEAISEIEGEKVKFYPVLKGVVEGEQVVIKANFLIDSQSQITGVAAAAYGGALGDEEKKAAHVH